MKHGKKILAIILTLGMVATMLPQNTFAGVASGATSNTAVQPSGVGQTPEDGIVNSLNSAVIKADQPPSRWLFAVK